MLEWMKFWKKKGAKTETTPISQKPTGFTPRPDAPVPPTTHYLKNAQTPVGRRPATMTPSRPAAIDTNKTFGKGLAQRPVSPVTRIRTTEQQPVILEDTGRASDTFNNIQTAILVAEVAVDIIDALRDQKTDNGIKAGGAVDAFGGGGASGDFGDAVQSEKPDAHPQETTPVIATLEEQPAREERAAVSEPKPEPEPEREPERPAEVERDEPSAAAEAEPEPEPDAAPTDDCTSAFSRDVIGFGRKRARSKRRPFRLNKGNIIKKAPFIGGFFLSAPPPQG